MATAQTAPLPITRDLVRPHDAAEYLTLRDALLAEIDPRTAFESLYADQIVTATWRLRRCAVLEASLVALPLDPMEDPDTGRIQTNIDRSRAHANRILRASTVQLREVRRHRAAQNSARQKASELALRPPSQARIKADAAAEIEALMESFAPRSAHLANRTQSPAATAQPTPRNAPCHCGSGIKFKRCCGPNAPAVLGRAA